MEVIDPLECALMPHRGTVLLLLLYCGLLLGGTATADRDRAGLTHELRAGGLACALCDDAPAFPIVRLREPDLEEIGRALHRRNVKAAAVIDSLYRTGYFGPPGSGRARKEARRGFKIKSANLMDYIADLSSAQERILEIDEAALAKPFFDTFVNPGFYPIRGLQRGRTGLGSFCMEYDLDRIGSGRTIEAPPAFHVSLVDATVMREPMRLLKMRYESGLHRSIDLLFEPRYCGRVERRITTDRGVEIELVLMTDIEGSYVGKWGIHRIAGLAFWRSIPPDGAWDHEQVRIGSVAYFPGITFRLPFFLPDLGLDDIRDFDLPQPLWERKDLEARMEWPDWMGIDAAGNLPDWTAEGPRPMLLDQLFPDY